MEYCNEALQGECGPVVKQSVPFASSQPFAFFTQYGAFNCATHAEHYQLRDNVKCIERDSVWFYDIKHSVKRFNLISNETDVIGHSRHLNCFSVLNGYIAIGGEGNVFVSTYYNAPFLERVYGSYTTNGVKLFYDHSVLKVAISSNDDTVRIIDLETASSEAFNLSKRVNDCSIKNDLIATALDYSSILVLDARSKEIVHDLRGHSMNTFSVQWDPVDNNYLATCGEDKSMRIWDIRTNREVHVFCDASYYCYKLEYSLDGKYIAVIESEEYAHIFDKRNLEGYQTIKLKGNTTGLAFSPQNSLFIGVNSPGKTGIVEFRENN